MIIYDDLGKKYFKCIHGFRDLKKSTEVLYEEEIFQLGRKARTSFTEPGMKRREIKTNL